MSKAVQQPEPIQCEINLDQILTRCNRSLHKALTFRQFAVSGEHNIQKVNDFSGPDQSLPVWQMTRAVSVKDFDQARCDYIDWSVGNCVREMIEGLYIFIDETVVACNLATKYQGTAFPGVWLFKEIADVRKKTNFTDKLDTLREIVTLTDERTRQLHTLNRIRNCLSHHGGIVTEHGFPDFNAKTGERLIGEWFTTNIYLVGVESGKKSKIKAGMITTEQSSLVLQIDRKLKKVLDGKPIVFSFDELNEIAFTIQQLTRDIILQVTAALVKL